MEGAGQGGGVGVGGASGRLQRCSGVQPAVAELSGKVGKAEGVVLQEAVHAGRLVRVREEVGKSGPDGGIQGALEAHVVCILNGC